MVDLTMVKMEDLAMVDLAMVDLTMVDLTMVKMGDLTMEVSTMVKMGDLTMEVSTTVKMGDLTMVVSTMVNVAVNADLTSLFNTTVEFKATVEHPTRQVYFLQTLNYQKMVQDNYRYENTFLGRLWCYTTGPAGTCGDLQPSQR